MHAIFRHVRPEAKTALRGHLFHSLVPAGATASEREREQQQSLALPHQNVAALAVSLRSRPSLGQRPAFGTLNSNSELGVFHPTILTLSRSETQQHKSKRAVTVDVLNDSVCCETVDSSQISSEPVPDCSTSIPELRVNEASNFDLSLLTSEQADDVVMWLTDGDVNERRFATEQITGLFWPLARHQYGSRVAQRALEIVDPGEQMALAEQLQGHVIEASKSPHANYVLQKCVEVLPAERIQFIVDEIAGRAVVTSRHRFGCRILQRLIEHCPAEQTMLLVAEVMSDAPRLCRHPFGNFVLQHILEHGTSSQQSDVVDVLMSDAPGLARHRIASHVLQCALVHCTHQDRNRLIDVLTDGSPEEMKSLAHSQYGSFVVREITGKRHA